MLSLYIIIENNLPDSALDIAAKWLEINRPPFTTVMSGGQIDRAMEFAERILPWTRVIFRVFPNDGILKTYNYDAGAYFGTQVAPYEDWLHAHNIIWHVDNESAESDLAPYAKCSAEIIQIAHERHIAVAVGSFATGNPAESQYAQLDPMWKALAQYRESIWTPHEYHAQTPPLSGGHINRYMLAWARCHELGITPPITVIGEYGYLHSKDGKLDPEWGFRRDGLTGIKAAEMDISYHHQWYAPDGVTACVYAFCGTNGKWKDLNVNDDGYLSKITGYNASLQKPIPTPPVPGTPPVPIPTPPTPPSGKISIPRADLLELKRSIDMSVTETRKAIDNLMAAANALQVGILSMEMVQEQVDKWLGE